MIYLHHYKDSPLVWSSHETIEEANLYMAKRGGLFIFSEEPSLARRIADLENEGLRG